MPRDKTQNTNLASEFFIASQLFRLGYIVTLTLGHTKEIDIIAIRPNDKKVITIDVKGLKNTTNWPLTPKRKEKNHYFILVAWRNKFDKIDFNPEVFVIPSIEINKVLSKWSGKPDVTCVGYSKIKNSKYKDAWNLLKKINLCPGRQKN